jgi:SEC-C motif
MAINRNDPCPCGSGKKYKRCCLGKPVASNSKHWKLVGLLAIFCVGVTVAIWFSLGSSLGFLSAALTVMVVGAIALFTDPPDPKAGGADPSTISFGG